MTLRARWLGPPPRPGDYLMSPVRPRYAYRVEAIHQTSRRVLWDPWAKKEQRKLSIAVERVAIGDVPKNARVHAWRWDKRAHASS